MKSRNFSKKSKIFLTWWTAVFGCLCAYMRACVRICALGSLGGVFGYGGCAEMGAWMVLVAFCGRMGLFGGMRVTIWQ